MVEITAIYPGFYAGRAPRVHLVRANWSQSDNGFAHVGVLDPSGPGLILCFSTLIFHAGTLVHIGQTFFSETWNDEVYKTSPCTSSTNGVP